MKAVYVLIFVIGVCLGDDLTSSNSANGPKAPTAQGTNHSPKENKENRVEPNPDPKTTNEHTPDPKTTNEAINPAIVVEPKIANTSTTPTPLPTTTLPPPEKGIGSWNVTDGKGNVCILIKGEMTLNMVNEMNKTVIRSYPVYKNTPSHGNCVNQSIEFDLPNNCSLYLKFEKNDSTSTFYLNAIKAKLHFNSTEHKVYTNNSLRLFENPLAQSYYCAPSSDNLVATGPMLHLRFKVNDLQVQAFMNSSKAEFDSAVNCETHTPDVVPIVVGCALAILVILVLVAYLISRRRSQARGYLSM